jgi:hypothetical protein
MKQDWLSQDGETASLLQQLTATPVGGWLIEQLPRQGCRSMDRYAHPAASTPQGPGAGDCNSSGRITMQFSLGDLGEPRRTSADAACERHSDYRCISRRRDRSHADASCQMAALPTACG